MTKTTKSLLGMALCLCLLLGIMLGQSVPASAEETKTGYGVTIDGVETLYTDYIFGALDAATAAESATLTLYQDTPDDDNSWLTSGNVTLDLNGHKMCNRLMIDGATVTVTDSSNGQGTILNFSGYAVVYSSGKLTIDASVDCAGEGEGHEAWWIQSVAELAASIGSTGSEDIVLPEGLVGVDRNGTNAETTSIATGGTVEIHRHSWTEGGCENDDTCSGCATVVPAPGHGYNADTGTCPSCRAAVAEAVAGDGTTFRYYRTLAEAVDAAEADTSITSIRLNRDVTLSDYISMNSGAFTVDLNGYRVTSQRFYLFYIDGAKVTFLDSSADKTGAVAATEHESGWISLFYVSSGELTIGPGSYSCTQKNDKVLEIKSGTVTIQDGAELSAYAGGNHMVDHYEGTLIIEGGTFTGGFCAVGTHPQSTITIKGGTFTGAYWADIYYDGGTIDLTAMGSDAVGMTIRAMVDGSAESILLADGIFIVDYMGNIVTSVTAAVDNYTVSEAAEVSFDANGGTGTMEPVPVIVGENYILPECTMTAPEGYIFEAWVTDPDDISLYAPGDSMRITGDVTLYARWIESVEVSFDANGGTGTMEPITTAYYIQIPECGFEPPAGKVFVGWSDSADGSAQYYPDEWIPCETDITLYAVWKADSVYVGGVELTGGMYLAVGSTEPSEVKPEGGYAWYEKGVLTLNNYTYTGEGYAYYETFCAGIYAPRAVTLVLLGENSLELTSAEADGICVRDNLTINGTGALTIVSTYNGIYVDAYEPKVVFGGDVSITLECGNNEGVYIFGDTCSLEIGDNVRLTIGTEEEPIGEEGIYLDGGLYSTVTITDNARINIVTSDEEAITAYSEDVSEIVISGSPVLNLIAEENALEAYNISISGGTLFAVGGEGYNTIEADSSVSISGGVVSASGGDSGIYAYEYVYISGGYVKAEGLYTGIYACYDLDIYGSGTEVIASCDPDGDYAIYCDYEEITLGDTVQILVPEEGSVYGSYIEDADGSIATSVHLIDTGALIYVGGVGMANGDYLDEEGNISDTKPEAGGYAHFTYFARNGGVLTLHNYYYEGDGCIEEWDWNCVIGTELAKLTVVLEGENELVASEDGFWAYGDVTFTGSGTLWIEAGDDGLYIEGDMTVDTACVGTESEYPLYGCHDVTVKNGGYLELDGYYGYGIMIENLTLDYGSLYIEDEYLMVGEYDENEGWCVPGTITLNGAVLTYPTNGYIDEFESSYGDCLTVYTEDGYLSDCVEFCNDGWQNYWDGWCYYDAEEDVWADGLVRLPYPPVPIDGITYGPEQSILDYYESKGETFIDAEEGWFLFYETVFMSDTTGIDFDLGVYIENGFLPWFPGFVEEDGAEYYFLGDEENGGNKLANGDVRVYKNNGSHELVTGGMYTFEDGVLCQYDGITEMDDGSLRYYEDAQLMLGAGLLELEDGYIYVRSNGELAVNCEYWITNNNGMEITVGKYTFDENGYMVIPDGNVKEGVYYEENGWYYYENGKLTCNKGLISVETTWYAADGTETVNSGYIYVRSNGQLATGAYFITNVGNDTSGQFQAGQRVVFDENGIAQAPEVPKHGIVDVDGTLYFYQDGVLVQGAGLIQWNNGWIYVRSDGRLATGNYWVTNTNGEMEQGQYEFGTDGYMIISDVEDGIVSEGGKLYYFVDGKRQYGLGLVQLEVGKYIYVRSNGELATGLYWITNHNGYLEEKMYDFGPNGILTIN